jgi:hypothetical protein
VVEIKENMVTILPKDSEINELVNFDPNQLVKHFKLGNLYKTRGKSDAY